MQAFEMIIMTDWGKEFHACTGILAKLTPCNIFGRGGLIWEMFSIHGVIVKGKFKHEKFISICLDIAT